MPLLSKMVTVDHKKYLDGGISLPIAYQRAMDLGYKKIVLVLTRNHGYRKKPLSSLAVRAYNRYFEPLPQLKAALFEVPDRYNWMQEEIDRLERPVRVSRLERDLKKLQALHQEGRETAVKLLPALRSYLEI